MATETPAVRELRLVEARCDEIAARLSHYSERYRREGRDNDMYRANTAWHNVVGIREFVAARIAELQKL